MRPNERFSGRGHTRHICKECQRKPRIEREKIELEQELEGYLHQSYISEKNVHRLRNLAEHADLWIREGAALIRDIGIVTPYRRRRFPRLAREHREILERYNAFFELSNYSIEAEDAYGGDLWTDGEFALFMEAGRILDEMNAGDEAIVPDRECIDQFADV